MGQEEKGGNRPEIKTQSENFHSTKSVLALPPPLYNQKVSPCFLMSINYLQDDQVFKINDY